MNVRNSWPVNIINYVLYDLVAPCNLFIWWNFGSIIGICLVIQFISGIFLSMHYTADGEGAFECIGNIIRVVNLGWLLRYSHANGASIFFICIYVHIGRGLYYGSYNNKNVWHTGVILFFLTIAAAFLGYVLPWGQISYWGATVITNFFTIIPINGTAVCIWIWGDWVVGGPTLNRFYTFHFLIPFLIVFFVVLHLMFLHDTGSNNPLGFYAPTEDVPFHPYYTLKDLVGIWLFLIVFSFIVFFCPDIFIEGNNYFPADSIETPDEINPEWYFLFAYSILRAIPNKVGGILALAASILVLWLVPMLHWRFSMSMAFYPLSQFFFWCFVWNFCCLTRLGTSDGEEILQNASAFCAVSYFLYFTTEAVIGVFWDKAVLWR